ncbi:MAG: hypothetical protein IJL85_02510 [Erysipelotrichaceae bacterium]|nr:hypothetical protein [Erysipelotrichaceae bacterium]
MNIDALELLIKAHVTGEESFFEKGIEVLAQEEEEKGNPENARRIREALKYRAYMHRPEDYGVKNNEN